MELMDSEQQMTLNVEAQARMFAELLCLSDH